MRHFEDYDQVMEFHDQQEDSLGVEYVRISTADGQCGGYDCHDIEDVPVPGQTQVVADSDFLWGGPESSSYRSAIYTDMTFGEMVKIAEAIIKTTKDDHHVFFEGWHIDQGATDTAVSMGFEHKIIRFSFGS